MQRLIVEHLQCVHQILRYVSSTKDRGHGIAEQLVGYTNVDWIGDASDRRSTSGFMFSIESAGVAWSSKKQSIVVLSSIEAEY